MRFFSFICLFFFCAVPKPTYSQDPYLQDSSRSIREEATEITAKYQPGLVMGIEQALLFKEKVAEFLIRKKAVLATDFSPRKKLFYLKRLSSQESSEMVDILEPYKIAEYLRLKKIIQPLPTLQIAVKDSLH